MDKEKEEYFRKLYALLDDSDEEKERSDAREVLNRCKAPTSASSSSSSASDSSTKRPSQKAIIAERQPEILRTTSESLPAANSAREPRRKTSLLRHNISNEDVVEETILEAPAMPPRSSSDKGPRSSSEAVKMDSFSTPRIGADLVMKNSAGVTSMLSKRKKKAKKDSVIKLVPEPDRVFAGQTFFYIPADDVAPLRKVRINRARTYGAVWTKEWAPSITHVVVDKGIKLDAVMAYLKPLMHAEALPETVALVNEGYPLDCVEFKSLLDPEQKCYAVEGPEPEVESQQDVVPLGTQKSDKSLEPKQAKPSKHRDPDAKDTTQFSMTSSQGNGANGFSPGVWLPQEGGEAALVESPREASPPKMFGDPSRRRDELDEMIEVARGLEYLDVDDVEDKPSSSEGPEDSGTEDDEAAARSRKRKYGKKAKGTGNGTFNQTGFSCMTGGTGMTLDSNPNRETIAILQEMADHYERTKNQWRVRAYQRVIGTLKKQTSKITTYEEAIVLPFIGHRLAEKIQEIATTHRLKRLENAQAEPGDKILQLFLKIYGSGLAHANKWMLAGYRTLDDLEAKAHLTSGQKIGIEHYVEFNRRIPRDEVTALGEIVKNAAAEIDAAVEAVIGGSYRRGAATSGDIDFIITRHGTKAEQELVPFLQQLTSKLTSDGFLVAALAVGGSKWHGACVLPGTEKPIWRRIDFLLVPASQLGAALIYFTGDDIFNRSIRLLSQNKGWRLNQRGLYRDVLRGRERVKLNEGSLIEGADEKKIFEILGVPFRPPTNRICH